MELLAVDATALDVAEEAPVVREVTGEWNNNVGRGDAEQARFVADTGATTHVFPNAGAFENYQECDGKNPFSIVGYDDVRVTIGSRVGTTDLLLKRVAHVPKLNFNLVSLTALLKQKGYLVGNEHALEVLVEGGKWVDFPL